MYELPFGKHPGLSGYLGRGWQVAQFSRFRAASLSRSLQEHSAPTRVRISRTARMSPEQKSRYPADARIPSDSSTPRLLSHSRSEHTATQAGTPLLVPVSSSWDSSVVKNFSISEGHQLQFRFEAFNVTNHPNWDTPGLNLDRPDFGKIRSTRTAMRELQIALKYIFNLARKPPAGAAKAEDRANCVSICRTKRRPIVADSYLPQTAIWGTGSQTHLAGDPSQSESGERRSGRPAKRFKRPRSPRGVECVRNASVAASPQHR